MTFAVLTGDIVGSSELTARELEAAMAALGDAAGQIGTWEDGIVTAFARRGGDGWQLALDRPHLSLRAVLFLKAALRRADPGGTTRIAVAEGDGTLPPPPRRDPNAAHGPAFTASGRALGAMPRHARLTHAAGGAMAAAFRLADHISDGWTQAQARALFEVLPPGSGKRAEAAARIGITREAVNQALWSAGYRALSDAMNHLEAPG